MKKLNYDVYQLSAGVSNNLDNNNLYIDGDVINGKIKKINKILFASGGNIQDLTPSDSGEGGGGSATESLLQITQPILFADVIFEIGENESQAEFEERVCSGLGISSEDLHKLANGEFSRIEYKWYEAADTNHEHEMITVLPFGYKTGGEDSSIGVGYDTSDFFLQSGIIIKPNYLYIRRFVGNIDYVNIYTHNAAVSAQDAPLV